MRQRAKGSNIDEKSPSHSSEIKGRAATGSCHFIVFGLLVIVGLLAAIYFLLPPTSDVREGPQFTGAYAVNDDLQKGARLFEGNLPGPESFAIDKDGNLYTGLLDGRVVKIDLTTETYTLVTRIGDPPYDKCGQAEMMPHCGRPLGMRFDNDGNLIVADAYKGLFSINPSTGNKELLFKPQKSGDLSCHMWNNPVVLSNGSIFFTCTSNMIAYHRISDPDFSVEEYLWQPHTHNDSGGLFHYNSVTGSTTLVMKEQLFCPNGVSKSSNDDFLVVSDMVRGRIAKYYLKGPKAGKWDTFVSSLPGMPDNITPSKRTPGFWVAIPMVRPNALLDFSYQWSLLQLVQAKLGLINPLDYPNPALHTMVVLFDEEGRVVRSLHDPSGKVVIGATEVVEMDDELIIGSVFSSFMVKMKLD